MSVTLDQLPKAIADATAHLAELENSFRIISELPDGPVKVYIEAVSDWFELDKAQVVKLYQDRVDAAKAAVKKLTDLQTLLNQTLADALSGK